MRSKDLPGYGTTTLRSPALPDYRSRHNTTFLGLGRELPHGLFYLPAASPRDSATSAALARTSERHGPMASAGRKPGGARLKLGRISFPGFPVQADAPMHAPRC